MRTSYIIALGANRRHPRHGAPQHVVAAAIERLAPRARSRISVTPPLGPSRRRYANAAILIESMLSPPDLLAKIKTIEHDFGRRGRGQRWSARVLDLDIILWSGGAWEDASLTIPHYAFRTRRFVLAPLCEIVPHWRDPISHLSVRHLLTRLDRKQLSP